MQTFDEFSEAVVDTYDELKSFIEKLAARKDITRAEMLCVLSSMLCQVASDANVSEDEFLDCVKSNYRLCVTLSDARDINETIH